MVYSFKHSYSCRDVSKVAKRCVPTTGRFDKHYSLVDACHVMGTVHLHKYWALVCFSLMVSKYDEVKGIAVVCFVIKLGLFASFPHSFILTIRQATCLWKVWFGTSSGQVREIWECDPCDQADAFASVPKYEHLPDKLVMEAVWQLFLWLLV